MGIAIVATHMCKQRPLQFTLAPQARSDLQVHVLKRSCSHFSQVCHAEVCPAQSLKDRNAHARTDTKEGKTQANHGLCRGLSILLAEIGSRCAMGIMWDLLL